MTTDTIANVDKFSETTWPEKSEVEKRIDRIVQFLVTAPFGTPDWYSPDLDPVVMVQVSGTGLYVGKDMVQERHNGFQVNTLSPPQNHVEFNLLRQARHKKLLSIYEQALKALTDQIRIGHNPNIVVNVPFKWDLKYYGPAPKDELGKLLPDEAKKLLEQRRDFHGDMQFAAGKYLREKCHVDIDRRFVC